MTAAGMLSGKMFLGSTEIWCRLCNIDRNSAENPLKSRTEFVQYLLLMVYTGDTREIGANPVKEVTENEETGAEFGAGVGDVHVNAAGCAGGGGA